MEKSVIIRVEYVIINVDYVMIRLESVIIIGSSVIIGMEFHSRGEMFLLLLGLNSSLLG